jgi:hypothetical protein
MATAGASLSAHPSTHQQKLLDPVAPQPLYTRQEDLQPVQEGVALRTHTGPACRDITISVRHGQTLQACAAAIHSRSSKGVITEKPSYAVW